MYERRDISWSTPVQGFVLIVTGATFRTASKIAAIVGTLLTIVNQGAVILAGHAGWATWIRTLANFLIPYTVASIGYLTPFRRRDEHLTQPRIDDPSTAVERPLPSATGDDLQD